jgi:hypothetical protein
MPANHKTTTIKYQKSPSTITVYEVTHLALDLSRQSDGTISSEYEHNCQRAFEVLVKYHAQLRKIFGDPESPSQE